MKSNLQSSCALQNYPKSQQQHLLLTAASVFLTAKKIALATLVLLFTFFSAVLAQTSAIYNAPGTYTLNVPPGAIGFNTFVQGAGGGGGYNHGAGGGGGGFRTGNITGLSGGVSVLTITVGAGGAGGSLNSPNGVAGGNSSVVVSTGPGSPSRIATGGGGGIQNSGAVGAGGIGTFSGGAGAVNANGGAGGGCAGSGGVGSAPIPPGAIGGLGGPGTYLGGNGGNTGFAGIAVGGGGAGGPIPIAPFVDANNRAFDGARGNVVITWSFGPVPIAITPLDNNGSTNDAIICSGSSITLSAASATPLLDSAYLWSNGATTSSINVSPTVNTNYTVTVTCNGGGVGVQTIAVTVDNLPLLSTTGPYGPVCNFGSGPVALSGSPGGAFPTFPYGVWSDDSSAVVGDDFYASGFTVTGDKIVKYTYTDRACEAFVTTTVHVDALIVVNAGPDGAPICAGDVLDLTGGNSNVGGGSGTWTTTGAGSITPTAAWDPAGNEYNSVLADSGSIVYLTLTGGSNGACPAGSDDLTVQVHAEPEIVLTSSSTEICFGATSFNIPYTLVTNAPTTYTLTYADGGANPLTGGDITDAPLTISPLNIGIDPSTPSGSYLFTLQVNNACIGPIQYFEVIVDQTAPVFTTCPNTPASVVGCSAAVVDGYSTTLVSSTLAYFTSSGGVATDACTISDYDYIDVATGTCPIVVTRTWTVTDNAGNAASCDQIINVVAPALTITCPANVTVNQHDAKDPYATGYATPSFSNCNGAVVVTYNDNRSALNLCNATGIITRTWTATSACGLIATCVQTITVQDVDNPVATCPANITVPNDLGNCSAVVNFTSTGLDFGHFQGFENPAYLSASDYINIPSTDWNNYSSVMTRVPSGTDGITSQTGAAHAVINSTVLPTAPYDYSGVFSRLGGYNNVFGTGFISKVDVYFDVAYAAANPTTYGWDLDQAVSNQANGFLRDFIYHVAGDGGGIYVGADNNTNFTRQSPAFIQSQSHALITTSGWYTMEWEAKNVGGNLAVDFNLRNATSNVIVWTKTITTTDVIATAVGGNRYMWFNFIAADKLAVDNTSLQRKLAATSVLASGSAFPVGTSTVTSTVTDACGLTGTCTFDVTVDDTEKPIITTCPNTPASVSGCTASAVNGYSTTPVTSTLAYFTSAGGVATDNCAVTSYSYVDAATGTCPIVVTRTWTVTDAANNVAIACNQIINVIYTVAPVVPVNGVSTVECLASATVPIPPTVTDQCGNSIAAVLVSTVDNPLTITCEGTRTYTYTYTDCANLVSTWTYTYTIDHTTAPSEVGGPVSTSSTVECEASATAPVVLPVVQDVCGAVLAPTGPVKQVSNTNNFNGAVTLAAAAAPGVWYNDRYAPAGFSSPVSFGGDNRLKHSIDAADGASSRPGAYSSTFYNTQGRAYDLGASTDAIAIKLYVPSAWATTNKRMAGMWGVAVDNVNAVSGYPIVEFTSDGNNPRFRVYDNGTFVDLGLPSGFAYNSWVTLKIRLLPTGQFLMSAGSLSYTSTAFTPSLSVKIKSAILQGHNYDPSTPGAGVTYDIYWDDFTYNDAYAALACEGDITYTNLYTDCSGLVYPWVYTYTIDHVTAPVVPANGVSSVECLTSATPPTPPTVVDVCGASVPAVLVSTVDAPITITCEGTRTYNYTYTDCSGLVSNWTYTYTIDHVTNPAEVGGPVSIASTVECAASATAPSLPVVKDVCGNTLTPTGAPVMGGTYVDCEGTITYTYSYADCSGLPFSWTYTYTIDHVTAPLVSAANGASTVECLTSATPPTPPSGIVDVCGAPVPAVLVSTVDLPSSLTCEGTRTYTYTYTDCANLVSTWTYTYTIDHTTAPSEVGGPVASASTVECEASATAPVVLPVVQDVCGAVIAPTGPVKQVSNTNNFNGAVAIAAAAAPGVWYTDRYAPAGFSSPVSFGGDNRLKHSIDAADGASSRPGAYSSTFYNTQGRAYDLGTSTDAIAIKLYVPSAWATTNKRMAGMWGVAVDNVNAVSGYPIVEFTSDGNNPRFRVYDNGTFVDLGLPSGFAYNSWVTLKIRLLPTGQFLMSAGSLSYTSTAFTPSLSVKIKSAILQGHNYDPTTPGAGVTYDIYWDDFTYNDAYAALACEGDITYTNLYTDCSGLVYPWVYTYTIDHVTAPAVPANGVSSVECLTSATPPTPPTVVDVCGASVPAVLVSTVDAPITITCEGTRTYNYTYTDCSGLVSNWTYTYTIDHVTNPAEVGGPVSIASTVECAASATAPSLPVVKDVCGNTLTPTGAPVMGGTYVDCEGTITYTYSYADCSGLPFSWTYTYTIDHVTAPVVSAANGASTVECLTSATPPTPPSGIVDVCGAPVPAVLVSTVDNPLTITCEGTRTYTYTYTDCANLVSTWTYTYTIDHTTAPSEVGGPVSTSSTVECEASATAPVVLPVVQDVCGAVIAPTGPVKQVSNTNNFNGAVAIAAAAAPGVWYTDRYAPAGFSSPVSFGGDNRLKHSIDAADGASSRPGAYSSTFYNTQGRAYDLGTSTDAIAIKLYVPSAWATTNKRMAGMWGVAVDNVNAVSGYPIVEFTSDGNNPRFRVYDNGTFVDLGLPSGFAYNSWVTLKIRLLPTGQFLMSAGSLSYTSTAFTPSLSVKIKSAILQGHNYDPTTPGAGVTYDIYWDDFTYNDAYAALACEGDITYTNLYTDCSGLVYPWVYTYTVEYEDFTMPSNGGSIVSCPAATDVAPTLPTVTDNCGITLTPTGPVVSAAVVCEGDRTYTYTYTDCEGNTHDWVYTYTVDYSGGLTAPANTTATVSCPANATDPGAPADITDACGRSVSAVLVGSSPAPACNGSVVWTYRYTACDGTTTADWTYTYTVVYSGGLTAPANGGSTVSCAADAVNPGAPANITDACGRSVSAVLVGSSPAPACNGSVVWTYRYTACDGTTTADWTYTYTVVYSGGLTAPANGGSTVSCAADAVNPGAPANITDACGRSVSAVLVGSSPAPACNGSVVWTYRYTACDGTTTADWTYTYTVVYSGGLTAPANGGSTVSCAADAVNPGAPANITDACGRSVSAVLVGSSPAPACNGSVVWTYRYTACDGTTTADWTYTYTVVYSGGLTAPANGGSTVSCAADAVNPGAPANITDACGRSVSAVLVGSSPAPACNGSVVWTYRYTACDGTTTADWTYTYTVVYSGGLTAPANGGSTVSCAADAVNPGAPANITDACGRSVSAVLVGSSPAPACNGSVVWTYRYTACDGTTTADWTYTYTVVYSGGLTAPANGGSTVSCAADAVNPGAPANITDACGRSVSAVLVGSSPAPACNGSVVWTYRYTACDGTTTADWTYTYTVVYSGGLTAPANGGSTVSCAADAVNPGAPANITDACGRSVSAVLVGSSPAPACNGSVVWTYRYTACDGTTTADWTYTYTVVYSGGLTAPANGGSTVSCAADAVNPGAPANITDACGRSVSAVLVGSSPAPACNGSVVWTYRYTACDGTTTADWTYTYTVVYSGGLTAPANGGSTVSCAADAVNPGAPANITDACGRSVSAVLVGSSPAPACNGSVVWTYRYTACDGTTTADWTYTYTVVYSGGLTAPANGGSTVSCAADAVNPGAPANITDACGRSVSAVLVGSSPAPACNGSVVWTYRYTACDGTTTADWTYTYTINNNIPPSITGTIPTSSVTGCLASNVPAAVTTVAALESMGLVISDDCTADIALSVTSSDASAGTCPIVVTRTYIVTDLCGNASTYAQTINVVEPVLSITCPIVKVEASCQTQTAIQSSYDAWLASVTSTGGCNTVVTNNAPLTAPNKCGGTVTVLFTATSTCDIKTCSSTFTVTAGAPISIPSSKVNVLCKGNNTGSINTNPAGGCPPYLYLWNDGFTTQNRTNLFSGNYTVTVSDGCQSFTKTISITQPTTGILLTGTKKNPKCNTGATGTATVTVSGGVGPYTYAWSTFPVQTTNMATGLAAGIYSVTVTDASNGCTRSMLFTLVAPSPVTVALTATNPTNFACNNGQIVALAGGGTPNYVYLWSNSKTTATVTGLSATTYTVKVTDKNGCTVTASATLTCTPTKVAADKEPLVSVNVLPNPSNGLFNVRAIAIAPSNATLELMDLTGRIVIMEEMQLIAGNNAMMLDAQAFPKGIYVLRFTVDHKTETIRLVIQ